jgi:hypothetical protein
MRQEEIDKARQEEQDDESVQKLEDALAEIKAAHADEVDALEGQLDFDAHEVEYSSPPPTPPPGTKKKTKREVSAVVQNHLPSAELTGAAQVYWDNHVHVFDYSYSEQTLLTHDPFVKY